MTLQLIEGFDNISDPTEKWPALTSSSASIVTGRYSGSALKFSSSYTATNLKLAFADTSTIYVGFAMKSALSVNSLSVVFFKGTTAQCNITFLNTGTVYLYRGGSYSYFQEASSSGLWTVGQWHYFEIKMTISNSTSAGDVKLYVDGVEAFSCSSGNDTQASGTFTTIDSVSFVGSTTSPSADHRIDDIYIDDAGVLGECRIETLYPDGNGYSSDWVGSDGNSTDNYLLVDDATPDNDTTYIASGTATDLDTFTVDDLSSTPSSIHGVKVEACARKTDSGARSIDLVCRPTSTDYDGDTHPLTESYLFYSDIFEDNPQTSSAWTESTLNATEFGVEVTV